MLTVVLVLVSSHCICYYNRMDKLNMVNWIECTVAVSYVGMVELFPADMLTKGVTREKLSSFSVSFGLQE
jgi:hypothetical protein